MTSKPAPSSQDADEPKTETTLTTRIRINIPGSRPIPPVVVRKPVPSDSSTTDPEPAAASDASMPEESTAAPTPATEPKAEASGWFAPRKNLGQAPVRRPALPGPGAGPAATPPAGGADNGGEDMNGSAPGGQRPGAPRASLPQRPVGRTGAPGAPRAGAAGGFGAGSPGAGTAAGPAGAAGNGFAPGAPGPGAPGPGAPAGRLPVRGPGGPAAGPGARGGAAPGRLGAGGRPGAPAGPGAPAAPGNDFAPGGPAAGMPQPGGNFGPGGPGAPGVPGGPGMPGGPGAPGAPGGPGGFVPGGPGAPGMPGAPSAPAGPGADFGPGGDFGPARGAGASLNGVPGPVGPTTGPGYGTMPVAPRVEDEAAAYGSQWPGSEFADDAPTSALPTVPPPGPQAPRPGVPQAVPQSGPDVDNPALTTPGQPPRRPMPKAKKAAAARKGGSKVVLICSGVVALLGVAYGAGLLLNHSDVPKGTTVLGVDIGGTKEEALGRLDEAFGTRATTPIQLTVGGKQVELRPERAGLTLDAQTTVRNAEGSDYNPLSVIGSLFGNDRVSDPVLPVDDEKLLAALTDLAGSAGSVVEGTIKFEPNKVTPVPGKAGTTLDVDKSTAAVKAAFRTQLETGRAPAVELPVTTREPVVDQAELDRMMEAFAKPAMSAQVVIKAGPKSIPFGPARSLPKILGVKVVDGHLEETYDLEALKELYGDTFDGVLVTRAEGKTPVTPQDVVMALRKALHGKTTAERVGVIETDPS
ncbi:hypothetical protein [Streptomyces sp. NPDC093225]|uniref:hypothetical protein n=1 Tax=Streptomyces sp. NPDC093225 TaxID=3366034 RepID=UPI0038201F38